MNDCELVWLAYWAAVIMVPVVVRVAKRRAPGVFAPFFAAVPPPDLPQPPLPAPQDITVAMIDQEPDAGRRWALFDRMGPDRYRSMTSTLEHMDALTIPGSAPRALVRDRDGVRWLVGTDGSTKRVFWMRVAGDVATCGAAHELISGFDEARLIAEC